MTQQNENKWENGEMIRVVAATAAAGCTFHAHHLAYAIVCLYKRTLF